MNLTIPLKWSYFLMLLAGLLIPSDGSQGFLNLKSLTFLSTAFLGIAYIGFKARFNLSQLKLAAFGLGTFVFLFIWLIVGVVNQNQMTEGSIAQLKLFIITLFVPLITLYLISEKIMTPADFFKWVIYGNCAYCTLKIGLIILHLAHVVNMWDVLDSLGLRFMKMQILGNIDRLQTSVDIITPFSVFFALQSEKLGIPLNRRFRLYYCVVALLSNFLSFSRFLIFIYFLSGILYLLSCSFSKMGKGFILIALGGVVAIGAIGVENTAKIIELRLFSKDNFLSDNTRTRQANALIKEFSFCPLMGKGLGGYAKECIRDEKLLYSYEVQWIAFLMQFGVIGISFLLFMAGFILWQLLRPPLSRVKTSALILFLLWLFSGFTNPFLISLTSGIAYTLFLLTQPALKENRLNVQTI